MVMMVNPLFADTHIPQPTLHQQPTLHSLQPAFSHQHSRRLSKCLIAPLPPMPFPHLTLPLSRRPNLFPNKILPLVLQFLTQREAAGLVSVSKAWAEEAVRRVWAGVDVRGGAGPRIERLLRVLREEAHGSGMGCAAAGGNVDSNAKKGCTKWEWSYQNLIRRLDVSCVIYTDIDGDMDALDNNLQPKTDPTLYHPTWSQLLSLLTFASSTLTHLSLSTPCDSLLSLPPSSIPAHLEFPALQSLTLTKCTKVPESLIMDLIRRSKDLACLYLQEGLLVGAPLWFLVSERQMKEVRVRPPMIWDGFTFDDDDHKVFLGCIKNLVVRCSHISVLDIRGYKLNTHQKRQSQAKTHANANAMTMSLPLQEPLFFPSTYLQTLLTLLPALRTLQVPCSLDDTHLLEISTHLSDTPSSSLSHISLCCECPPTKHQSFNTYIPCNRFTIPALDALLHLFCSREQRGSQAQLDLPNLIRTTTGKWTSTLKYLESVGDVHVDFRDTDAVFWKGVRVWCWNGRSVV
ncbi:hypothetical protein HDU85_006683 [Gaertneriomyces sp. JEL0708]|nr:hypothetical protein HDU85_006683 [Gaertneriomyces sp. JEL0708]